MASMPTNDNVRYSRPDNSGDTNQIDLREIGNNRYEDVVCKATHMAYKIGGFSRSANTSGDTDQCVLLMVSSSNFYARLPECWPWSCRRWTKEITYSEDAQGNKKRIDNYYSQNTGGDKISASAPPTFQLTAIDVKDASHSIVYPVYVLTKNTWGGQDIPDGQPQNMTGSIFYETEPLATAVHGQTAIDQSLLNKCKCGSPTTKITLVVEVFPVLCKGVCKLVAKVGYLCYNYDNSSSAGRSTKKLISPFWSCRINEQIEMFDEEDPERPLLTTVYLKLDGTDSAGQEVFGDPNNNKTAVITGGDYYLSTQNGVTEQVFWNKCDEPKTDFYFPSLNGEKFGKASTYLSAGERCCKYCKKIDEEGNIIFFNNGYCSALDSECDGGSYIEVAEGDSC
jgi:hypothetical protein